MITIEKVGMTLFFTGCLIMLAYLAVAGYEAWANRPNGHKK